VNVNAIAPGYMRTDNTAALQPDELRNRQILDRAFEARWGQANDTSSAAVFLCVRGEQLPLRPYAGGRRRMDGEITGHSERKV
jgi:NAD(P)-dependent dehydrogenase (short-subunit alcohol dehydrogenase family)